MGALISSLPSCSTLTHACSDFSCWSMPEDSSGGMSWHNPCSSQRTAAEQGLCRQRWRHALKWQTACLQVTAGTWRASTSKLHVPQSYLKRLHACRPAKERSFPTLPRATPTFVCLLPQQAVRRRELHLPAGQRHRRVPLRELQQQPAAGRPPVLPGSACVQRGRPRHRRAHQRHPARLVRSPLRMACRMCHTTISTCHCCVPQVCQSTRKYAGAFVYRQGADAACVLRCAAAPPSASRPTGTASSTSSTAPPRCGPGALRCLPSLALGPPCMCTGTTSLPWPPAGSMHAVNLACMRRAQGAQPGRHAHRIRLGVLCQEHGLPEPEEGNAAVHGAPGDHRRSPRHHRRTSHDRCAGPPAGRSPAAPEAQPAGHYQRDRRVGGLGAHSAASCRQSQRKAVCAAQKPQGANDSLGMLCKC